MILITLCQIKLHNNQYPLRDLKTFLKDITTQPPVLFPSVVLFHILWLLGAVWSCVQQPTIGMGLNVIWMIGYTAFWIGVSDQKKWGAFGYIGLTVINIIMYLSFKSHYDRAMYMSSLFLIDILFCFFIMFYFKRFK